MHCETEFHVMFNLNIFIMNMTLDDFFSLNINFKINVEKGIEFKFSNFEFWLAQE